MTIVSDLRSTIVPKSDQLNSEQLLTGPITIRVTDVTAAGSKEQPVSIHYDGDNGRPYKPCLTMRKVLILAWGHDGSAWVGKSMELFNDPAVIFGGVTVGGIRIARMSDIPKPIKVSLTASKGKKSAHEIGILPPVIALPALDAPPDDAVRQVVALFAACKTQADVKALGNALATQNRPDTDPVRAAARDAMSAAIKAVRNG